MEFLINNWEIILAVSPFVIAIIDRVVHYTPCKWDDLIWTDVKNILKTIMQAVKKKG